MSNMKRSMRRVFWLLALCFFLLLGYLGKLVFVDREEISGNSYNSRLRYVDETIKRGDILDREGEVIATSTRQEDGIYKREYPRGRMAAHITGYSSVGKTGVEAAENFELMKLHNELFQRVSSVVRKTELQGNSVALTMDMDIQTTAGNLLGSAKGAIVVMEPSTGRILALQAYPDFDPNTVEAQWDTLKEDADSPLVNRATQGLYPPGSTFKILTTLEYIQEHADYENYSYTCTGSYTVGNHTIHCYGNKSHGTQNLRQAFANSCNAFYASLGMELDIDQFGQLCNKMLFNTSLPTDLQASKSSFVLDKSDGSSAIMATSIGQGQTLVTPFHMALLVSAINNDGVLMKPYVLDRVESSDGTLVEQYEPEEYGTLMTTDEAAILKDYMNYVVETGTGKKLSGQSYEAAGKTGSAEYSTGADSSHSWFVGYAHRDDKSDIAIAVIVEKAGVGSEYAVPIAKEVFDAYYNE